MCFNVSIVVWYRSLKWIIYFQETAENVMSKLEQVATILMAMR